MTDLKRFTTAELVELLKRPEHTVSMQCPLSKPGYVGITSNELVSLIEEILVLRNATHLIQLQLDKV